MKIGDVNVGKRPGLTYSRSKSGTLHYYLRRKDQPRVRLGTNKMSADEIIEAYNRAIAAAPIDFSWVEAWAKRAVEKAKQRHTEVEISPKDVASMVKRQKYKCALTKRQFSNTKSATSKRRPLMPSIDRIDNSRGYILGNVRIVTVIANMARSDFSDKEVRRFLFDPKSDK